MPKWQLAVQIRFQSHLLSSFSSVYYCCYCCCCCCYWKQRQHREESCCADAMVWICCCDDSWSFPYQLLLEHWLFYCCSLKCSGEPYLYQRMTKKKGKTGSFCCNLMTGLGINIYFKKYITQVVQVLWIVDADMRGSSLLVWVVYSYGQQSSANMYYS